MRRPVRIFSIVFNETYIDWFKRGCLRSLLWPDNFAALQCAVAWDIWSTKKDADQVLQAACRLQLSTNMHAEIPEGASWADKEKLKPALLAALLEQIERCARDEEALLWIAPDSIFGEGSIRSILEIGAPRNVCVALAPMRVQSEGFIEKMGERPLSNPQLVKLAFENAHPAFLDAEANLPYSNSYVSGVSWRKVGVGLYAVTHLKHSAYLMQPTKEDARWFGKMKKFGAYDHSLPSLLVEQQRQRVIGSSDAAFVVELTPATAHRPHCIQADPDAPDRYQHDLAHHAANRNAVVIWRAA